MTGPSFRVIATDRRLAQVIAHLEDTERLTPTAGLALHRAVHARVEEASRAAFVAGQTRAGVDRIRALADYELWRDGVPTPVRDWRDQPD